jgi:hypothetical protein
MPTLKSIYQAVTGDTATHQRTIAALLDRESAARRRLVRAYIRGASDRAAGDLTGRSYGAARAMLRLTMYAIYRQARGLPRYWRNGRAHPKRDAERRATERANNRAQSAADLRIAGERGALERAALYRRSE